MIDEAVACETQLAKDLLSRRVAGLSMRDLQDVANVFERPVSVCQPGGTGQVALAF
jgi:hypothetical protein